MTHRCNPIKGLESLPAAYTAWRSSTLGRITDALEERLLIARIGPVDGKRILDVGCGDGVLAIKLARMGAMVMGIDASPRMIALAKARAEAAGADAFFQVGTVDALPFADAQFDIIVSVAVLCFSPDARQPVAEMARCLRPGGRIVLGELGRWNLWAAWRRVRGWLGAPVWRKARFRSRRDLLNLARAAALSQAEVRGAIFYPPSGLAARVLAPLDARLSRWTVAGAAFLVLTAEKPLQTQSIKETP